MFRPRCGALGAAPAGRAGGRDRGEVAGGELKVERGRVVEEGERVRVSDSRRDGGEVVEVEAARARAPGPVDGLVVVLSETPGRPIDLDAARRSCGSARLIAPVISNLSGEENGLVAAG